MLLADQLYRLLKKFDDPVGLVLVRASRVFHREHVFDADGAFPQGSLSAAVIDPQCILSPAVRP